MSHPVIIQGGMGAGVSNWRLARNVSICGQMGVVSGTALDVILARRLQEGDPGGDLRRALGQFPIPGMAQRALERYFVPGGKAPSQPFKPVPLPSIQPGAALIELIVLANFVEVFLAKEGHSGLVGINYLEKIQLPTLPALFGAMLADVDYVLMGAGIPMAIPGILDHLSRGEAVRLRIDVEDAATGEEFFSAFDPATFCGATPPTLKRPLFLAIIASHVLAQALVRKATGHVDGFVVEGPTAGGHNAPPRGSSQLNERGEPVYGSRDVPDLEKISALGLPFWLAGSYATPARLAEALGCGAAGIQVGTAFAFCEESGITSDLKARVLDSSRRMDVDIFTDPMASPTGFPFKVVRMAGTVSEPPVYAARQRVCDLGYLRRAYRKADGTIGYRCPGEPEEQFFSKGGRPAETQGRKCVCNGLLSTIGLGQLQDGEYHEPALLTAGDDVKELARFLTPEREAYSAADVIRHLLQQA
ncbi:MAG: nitronate monooxygenase [Verrucomicrobia bacterium]|nr:nitronate monooxygenase [Verrucomicrobiota bacterium]